MSVHSDDVIIQNTPIPVTGSGVAGTPGADVYSIQGITAGTPVPVSGTVTTSAPASNTSTVTQVVVPLNTNTTLLASNGSRKKAIIFIPLKTAFVKFGVTASATSFTYQFSANASTLEVLIWTGQIDVFSNIAQTINVTELT